jgi:hypothetical protein
VNKYADLDKFVDISNKTVTRYLNEIETTQNKGDFKPVSRVEPFLNIRNAISKAAGLTSLSQVCAIENMYSEDEVGVFLFGWHQTSNRPKLVSAKEANEFLRKNNVSISTSEHPDQQGAVHIGATLQAHSGDIICFYLRIVDSLSPKSLKQRSLPYRNRKFGS